MGLLLIFKNKLINTDFKNFSVLISTLVYIDNYDPC